MDKEKYSQGDHVKRFPRRSILSSSAVVIITGLSGCMDSGTDNSENTPSKSTATDIPKARRTDTLTETPILTTTPAPIQTPTPAPTRTPTPTPAPTQTPTPTPASTQTPRSPDQPKIREVQDNFGHIFNVTADHDQQFTVEDEIIVNDDTSVELCVTNISKKENDKIRFDYWFGHMRSDHPDSPEGWNDSSCWNWDMNCDYYSSDWVFQIWIRNEDNIYYHNESNESDFRVVVRYENLTNGCN